ncbi:class I SAM-dependent methyltransferase [Actinoplanes sp. CA-054009]
MRTFAAHSTARQSIAATIAHRWTHLTQTDGPQRPEIADLGTGDGDLLARILTQLNVTCTIHVVEPDDHLAPLAAKRLREHGHAVNIVNNVEKPGHIDAYLAAHVLFYLPDITGWFAAASAQLAPEGVLSTVVRAPTCDCYMLRHLVRQHLGVEPKFTPQQLHDLAAEHQLATDTVTIHSSFTYPVTDPRLAASPADSADPELARLICWLAGLPTDQPIPAGLRRDLNDFLDHRLTGGTLRLDQSDLLIQAAHCQPALSASHTRTSA